MRRGLPVRPGGRWGSLGRAERLPSLGSGTQRGSGRERLQRRSDAEQACKALHGNLTVKNTRLRVMWARRGKARATRDAPEAAAAGTGAAAAQMPPPPPTAGAAGAKRARPPPPGVRLPPGVKPYASMTPGASGANPSVHD